MIHHHPVTGDYSISSHQMWLPGSYDSEKTARYAFQFSSVELETLEKAINHPPASRQITLDDLLALRRANPRKRP